MDIYHGLNKTQCKKIVAVLRKWAKTGEPTNKFYGLCENLSGFITDLTHDYIPSMVYILGVGCPDAEVDDDGEELSAYPFGGKDYFDRHSNGTLWECPKRLLLCTYIADKLTNMIEEK